MKRIFSLPIIGLFIALLLGSMLTQAQQHFTAEVKGNGTPLILIHGLTCTGEVWKETVAHYQNKYQCHILTLAGFGNTPPALTENFLEAVKNDVLAYIKTNKLKKPAIIGHSMGGFLAFWTAASAPGTFSKVIAVDGVPFMPALQMPGATTETTKLMANNILTSMGNQTREQYQAGTRMYLATMITKPEHVNEVATIGANSDIKTQAQVMYEMYTTDLRKTIAAIDCPVMLMGSWIAYKDYGFTEDVATKAYTAQVAAIPNVKVEMSNTARHFIFYDDPAWFFQKTDAFLN